MFRWTTLLLAFVVVLVLWVEPAAAYYHPQLGRFVSRDPIGYQGGINLYEYVGDSPLGRTDPLGLQFPAGLPWGDNKPISPAANERHCDCCGLDITTRLQQLNTEMKVKFKSAPNAIKEAACYRMFGVGEAWDVLELYKPNGTFTSGQCGNGECEGTVQVNGQCYLAGEVNYYLWGLANRLCSEHFYGTNPSPAVAAINRWGFDQAVYNVAYYRSIKTFGDWFGNGIRGQVQWAKAGYTGQFPGAGYTVDKLHGLQCGKCTKNTAGPTSDGIYRGTLTGYFGSQYLILGFLWQYDDGKITAGVVVRRQLLFPASDN